jgi:hypothetical protein
MKAMSTHSLTPPVGHTTGKNAERILSGNKWGEPLTGRNSHEEAGEKQKRLSR